jgi:UDP-glucose 4-epimerase
MRTLVTGAAGFIGSHLVDRLLADGHQVVGIDNLSTGVTDNLQQAFRFKRLRPDRFSFARSDIQAPELADIVAGTDPEVIFHLAAQVDVRASVFDPQFDARNNILGTINLCEASRWSGVRRIVYAASGESRYGGPAGVSADEGTEVNPLSPFAVAKLAGEMYLRAYAEMYDLAPICLALAHVYGPRRNPRSADVIAAVGSAMVAGSPFAVYRDRTDSDDYVYVDDAVDAFVRAGCAPFETTGIYNIGTGRHTIVTEVCDLISAALGAPSQPSITDTWGVERPAVALNPNKAEEELGWKAAVDLPEGIRRTLDWLCATLEPEPPALIGA